MTSRPRPGKPMLDKRPPLPMFWISMVSPRQPILPPNRLFREFESGRMSRVQFQGAMAEHARDLIAEMEDERKNPVEAFMAYIRNRRIASKLAKKHGEAAVREIFAALAEVPDFAPASLLWNAGHRHVPLHCFIRDRKAPEFRVRDMTVEREGAGIDVEYGDRYSRNLTREVFMLRRGWHGNLFVEERQLMGR